MPQKPTPIAPPAQRHRTTLSLLWAMAMAVALPAHAQNPGADPALRKATLNVYASHVAATLLRQYADECAPDDKSRHAAALTAWQSQYQLQNFESLLERTLQINELEKLRAAQAPLMAKLKQTFPGCVSPQLAALYTGLAMNPGRDNGAAHLALVQTALANVPTGTSAVNAAAARSQAAVPAAAPPPLRSNERAVPLEGIYLNQSTGFGVGGAVMITFDSYAVFKDGTITSDLSALGSSVAPRNPKKWGRWQRLGNGFEVT